MLVSIFLIEGWKLMVAKILVNTSIKKLNRVYDYLVPDELLDKVQVGMRVNVNFGNGKGKQVEGIIVKLDSLENCKYDKLKYIDELLDTESYLDEKRLKLAKWIAKMYFCNVYDAFKLMLPPGTNGVNKNKDLDGKMVKMVRVIKPRDIIEDDITYEKVTSPKQIKLLRFLLDYDFTSLSDIINGLGVSRAVVKTAEKNGYIELYEIPRPVEEVIDIKRDTKLIPTDEQTSVINEISDKIDTSEYGEGLLYGVTGSGKTEVYLQIIEKCLSNGKNAIVLVPEIALTHQTKQRFIARFGDVVSVIHSKMTISERKKEWKRIKTGEAKIVIGPRSALFVPFDNIGLIIIDEEHDTSYSSFTTPKYITREVAEYMAYEYNAYLLLGSATPDVCTMYRALNEKIDFYELSKRPGSIKDPDIEIVDMKEEAVLGNTLFSSRLKEEIEKNLANKEQTFLFLNRRGFSSYVTCADCGHILKCMNCDVNLTYHKKSNLLLCHYCSFVEQNKNVCPKCKGTNLKLGSAGTQNIEEKIKELFPEAKVLRMDMDTTIKKGMHEKLLTDFKEGKADILVGTQMISKGHDIENVTLVGVINVDSTFAGNDFLATQRAFQNLLQVAGRAGRGSKKGRVILQAHDTDSYVLECVKNNSYIDFYNKEIEGRKIFNYPPFCDMLLIELSGEFKSDVIKDSVKLYDIFNINNNGAYVIYSPKSPFIQKINNKYRVHVLLKLNFSNKILQVIYENLEKYDKIKGRKISISITKNPTYIG